MPSPLGGGFLVSKVESFGQGAAALRPLRRHLLRSRATSSGSRVSAVALDSETDDGFVPRLARYRHDAGSVEVCGDALEGLSVSAGFDDVGHEQRVDDCGAAENYATSGGGGEGLLRAIANHRSLVLGGYSENLKHHIAGGSVAAEAGVASDDSVATLLGFVEHPCEVRDRAAKA